MDSRNPEASGLLHHLSEDEIRHHLRGFSEAAVSNALELRTTGAPNHIDQCLLGILLFYLPAGAQPKEGSRTDAIRLREDLGLDSLSVAESMFKIEELFGIRVETTEIVEIETIANARELLIKKHDLHLPTHQS